MTSSDIQQMPSLEPERAETGPMKFGSDWPGIFIRGDDAITFSLCLRELLDGRDPGGVNSKAARDLAETLMSCKAK